MAKITVIYARYKIMPNLQLHQLRVAAVAKQICDNSTQPVDTDSVIKACLLHDMGNLIKFELGLFPQFLEPEGLGYWQKIKDDFVKKYGKQEHHASIKIAKEIGVSPKVIENIDGVGFQKIQGSYFGGSLEQKICNYSDMRVAPTGVVSIHERMEDGAKRYNHRKDYKVVGPERDEIFNTLIELEKQLFADSKIKPSDITAVSTEPIIDQLRSYEI